MGQKPDRQTIGTPAIFIIVYYNRLKDIFVFLIVVMLQYLQALEVHVTK